jgi:hypothetical protein
VPNPHIWFAIIDIALGIFIILMCIPFRRCKIGPNAFVGFRIQKAFESDELWYKINKYGAERMSRWAAALVILGPISALIPFNQSGSLLAAVLLALLGLLPSVFLLIPVVQTVRYASKL